VIETICKQLEQAIEAAFSYGEWSGGWYARVNWKCQQCGKRNIELFKGKEPHLDDVLPLEAKCSRCKHKTPVIPYRWNEPNHGYPKE